MQTEGNGPAGTSAVDDGPSLAESIGELFGDYIEDAPDVGGSTAEGTLPDAGAPTSSAAGGSEGDAANAGLAGTPPAGAADAPLDEAGLEFSDDPLADATPFGYTVEGQARTADGIHLIGEHGAIIDKEYLPTLQRVFTERDHLFQQDQARYQKYQEIERLTKWDVRDHQGNTQTLTGRQGLEAQRTLLSRSLASLQVVDRVLSDPEQFARLVTVVADQQGNARIVADPVAMQHLRTQIENAAIRSEVATRQFVSTLAAPQPQPEAPVAALAMPTVDGLVQQLGAHGLTAEDKQFLASQLERYVRPTTAEERQRGLGTRIVDQSFVTLVQREAARAQQQARLAQTATTTATQNAARMGAAGIGARGRVAAPRTPQRAVSVAQQRATDADTAWDVNERANATMLRRQFGVA